MATVSVGKGGGLSLSSVSPVLPLPVVLTPSEKGEGNLLMWVFSVIFSKAHSACFGSCSDANYLFISSQDYTDVVSVLYKSLGRKFNPLLRVRND